MRDASCVRGRRIVCDDDLCRGVDETVCGLVIDVDFDLLEDWERDDYL